ncbi:MAG: glycosyltransferase family 39 protein, partial [Chloroflexi bacterium]|nr:glycosyltransferase family 39 protein [Chloroflexota bacterium]
AARLSPGDMLWWTATDIQPPLYYLLLRPWLLLAGDSEFVLRFLSLFFGVLTVPLLVVVARRLFGPRAGLLAGLLAAAAPLYVWYAQEARMYTLLTFLGLLSSYLLLRALDRPSRRIWLAYTLVSALALYTHYFAVFLLVFHLLYCLAHHLPRRANLHAERPISNLLVSQLFVIIAFLPWLPFMFVRLGTDASYWQGIFKLDEAVRHVLISFSVGESVLEEPAGWLTAGFVLVLAVAVIALLRRSETRRSLLFCALYLLVPIVLILALAAVIPKFNPRYLMLASPPVYIVLGAGLAVLTRQASHAAVKRLASSFTFLTLLLFILASFVYANWNLYTDPAFTKASFREAVRYIEAHKRPDEPVLICSGHMFTVFSYYYRADDWTPLPPTRILDVNRILTFDVADDLNQAVAGKPGVWLVLWQDEVADPVGFLFKLLDDAGAQIPTDAVLWQVRIRHYALPPDARFSAQPAIQHPLNARFGDGIGLHGYDQDESRLTLYWSALRPLGRDYKVTLRLVDAADQVWGQTDERPVAYLYPTTRWQPGLLLFGEHGVPVQPDTPPGVYTFEVGLYDAETGQRLPVYDEAGQPLPGDRVLLGHLTVP